MKIKVDVNLITEVYNILWLVVQCEGKIGPEYLKEATKYMHVLDWYKTNASYNEILKNVFSALPEMYPELRHRKNADLAEIEENIRKAANIGGASSLLD